MVSIETQVQRTDDGFVAVLTLAVSQGETWTSNPVRLQATSWGAAYAEARARASKLASALH